MRFEMKLRLLKKKPDNCKKCTEKEKEIKESNYKVQELELQVQKKLHSEIEMKMQIS